MEGLLCRVLPAEGLTGPCDAAPARGHRTTLDLGDLLVGIALDRVEEQGHRVLRWKPPKGRLDVIALGDVLGVPDVPRLVRRIAHRGDAHPGDAFAPPGVID